MWGQSCLSLVVEYVDLSLVLSEFELVVSLKWVEIGGCYWCLACLLQVTLVLLVGC